MARNIVCIRATGLALVSCACVLMIHLASAKDKIPHAAATDRFNYAELARVPEKARARKNPQEDNPDAVFVGRKLFAQHCAECHGPAGEGGKKAPSLRADEVQQATTGTLFWIVTNGVVRRGMPVWSKLPEPQRWAIVTYIKTLKVSTPSPRVADATAQ